MTARKAPQWRKGLLTAIGQFGTMRFVILCLCLMACNTPSPEFRGLAAQRVTVDGSTFDVRVRGDLAEAIRINMQYAPRFGPIEGRAAQAMAMVSGCSVTRITGDQALALGQLDCDGAGRPGWVPTPPMGLECYEIDSWHGTGQGRESLEFDCQPF